MSVGNGRLPEQVEVVEALVKGRGAAGSIESVGGRANF